MIYRILSIMTVFLMMTGSACADTDRPVMPKSAGKALALSLGGTVVPLAVGFGVLAASSGQGEAAVAGAAVSFLGLTVGPGVGHKYAGDNGRFWRGIALRTAGWGCACLSFAAGFSDVGLSEQGSPWEMVAVASLAVVGGSIVHDIATADNSARKYNERHGLTMVLLRPQFDPVNKGAGLQVYLRF